jgi:hypothetical protein
VGGKEELIAAHLRSLRAKGAQKGDQNGARSVFCSAVDSMATVGGKRAATVREVVAKSIGVELKTTQALEIAKAGRKDPATVAVNEFRFIETYIEKLHQTDPRGTYKFGQEVGDEGPTFQYSYVATSAARDFGSTAIVILWRLTQRS